jgi:hypothetical protein
MVAAKRKEKKPIKTGASMGHITNLKQSILETSDIHVRETIEQHALKNVKNYWNTNISSYLETSGGQNSNPYPNVGHFIQHQC